MSQRSIRPRILSIVVCIPALALALILSTAETAAAHAASPSTRSQQVVVKINGKIYHTSSGAPVRLPTTYPDGSKGWIDYTPGTAVTARQSAASISPKTVNCREATATQTWRNLVGTILAQYVLHQYWCWDGTVIKSFNAPYATWTTNLGWSLANSGVLVTQVPVIDSSQWGSSFGSFRFNGPFGIGCKSGANELYFYGNGQNSNTYNTNSYYGC
jgi:hypothetical protein